MLAKAWNRKGAVRAEENRIPGLPFLASPWSEEETGGNRGGNTQCQTQAIMRKQAVDTHGKIYGLNLL